MTPGGERDTAGRLPLFGMADDGRNKLLIRLLPRRSWELWRNNKGRQPDADGPGHDGNLFAWLPHKPSRPQSRQRRGSLPVRKFCPVEIPVLLWASLKTHPRPQRSSPCLIRPPSRCGLSAAVFPAVPIPALVSFVRACGGASSAPTPRLLRASLPLRRYVRRRRRWYLAPWGRVPGLPRRPWV